MSIIVAFSPVEYQDRRRREAQEVALQVLSLAPKLIVPVAFGFHGDQPNQLVKRLGIKYLNILKKDSSKIIGNDRRLPYIDEILNYCARIECKVFGYINSDILLNNKVYNILDEWYDAFIFSRSDIAEVSVGDFIGGKVRVIYGGDKHIGADGFFFEKKWWINNRDKFTDKLIIGETEWDTCYRFLIKKLSENYLESRVLFHVYHDAKWKIDSEGAKQNRRIWEQIKNAKFQ